MFNGCVGGPLRDGSGDPASTDKFAYVPHSTYGGTIRYTLPLAEQIGPISIQGNYYHQDSCYDSDLNDPNGLMNSQFDVRFFVKNATHQNYFTGGQSLLALGYGSEVLGAPRTYRADVAFRF